MPSFFKDRSLGLRSRLVFIGLGIFLSLGGNIFTPLDSLAATFNDVADGNWDSGATWGNDGDDVAGSGYPGSGDVAVIDSNSIILSANQTVSTTTISGGTFDFNGKTLTVTKNWNYNSGILATSTASSTLALGGSGDVAVTGATSTLNCVTFSVPTTYTLTINPGADLIAYGTTTVVDSYYGKINFGDVYIRGNLNLTGYNGTTNIDGTANFIFSGTGDQTIAGTGQYVPKININKPSGNLNLSGSIAVANGWTMTSMGTGTFDATSASTTVYLYSGTLSGATTTFDKLTFNTYSTKTLTIDSGAGVVVTGTTTFAGAGVVNTGNLYVQGDLVSTGAMGGSASLVMSGDSNQTISGNDSGYSPHVTVNKTSGNLLLSGNLGMTGWTMTSMGTGTFNAGSSTVYLRNRSGLTSTVTGATTTFNNVVFIPNGSTIDISAGADIIVNGTTTVQSTYLDGIQTGDVYVKGDLSLTGYSAGVNVAWSSRNTGNFIVSGTNNQIISGTGQFVPKITMNKTSGNVTLSGTIGAARGWVMTSMGSGIFDATSTGSTTVKIASGTLAGDGITNTFYNLVITGNTTLGSNLRVFKDLTINSSITLTADSYYLMVINGSLNNLGTLSGGNLLTGAPSLSASPSSVNSNSESNSVTFTGINTPWAAGTPGFPTFTLSGGTGASITAQTVISSTGAVLTINAGSSLGNLIVTDPSTGATTSLPVVSPIPVLTTDAASSVGAEGATLNATLTSQGTSVTQSGFAYGTDSTLSIVIATTTLGAQTGNVSFSSTVSGLSCDNYYYRAYATNSNGTGYGSIVSFETISSCSNSTYTVQAADLWDNGYDNVNVPRQSTFSRFIFTTTAPSITVNATRTGAGSVLGLKINNVQQSSLSFSSDSAEDFTVTLGSAGTSKTIELTMGFQSVSTGSVKGAFVNSVSYPEDYTLTVSSPSISNRTVVYGDSISAGAGTTYPEREGFVPVLRNTYNLSVMLEGWSYRALYNDASTSDGMDDFVERLSGYSPSTIWFAIGTNDYGLNKQSAESFGTEYAAVLDGLHSALPSARIFCQTPLVRETETANSFGDTLNEYRDQITSVCNDRPWTQAVDGTGILSLGDLYDSVHPSTSGHAKYANKLAPFFSSTGVTILGPSSGLSGEASSNFTVTLSAGATFTGTESVTVASSDGTISATAAGGSISGNNSSAVTVTPADDSISFTFTYTPASTGSKTITFTNAQNWTNPVASTYSSIGDDIAVPTPGSITFSDVSQTTITASTTATDDTALASEPFVYHNVTTGTYTEATSSAVIFSGLTANTAYAFEVGVVDSSNNWATSTTYSTTTLAEVSATESYTITASAGAGGSISPSGSISVEEGDSRGFTITADFSYNINTLLIDGVYVSTSTSHTFSNVTGNHTIVATFVLISNSGTNNVNISSGSGGGMNIAVLNSIEEKQVLSLYNQVLKLQRILSSLLGKSRMINNVRNDGKSLAPKTKNIFETTSSDISNDFSLNLKLGNRGDGVKALQIKLNNLGYIVAQSGPGSPGEETNYFGQATKKALIAYQLEEKIIFNLNDPGAGLLGPKTRASLNKK